MKRIWAKSLFYIGSLMACLIMALTSGCASGGFKLTRKYAGVVNSQHIILRIVLYLLTGIVFVVTFIVDLVVFNTIDFWQGKVSAGDYQFKSGNKIYYVRHELLPEKLLRRSTIRTVRVVGSDHVFLQEVVLSETLSGEIEMFVDKKKRAHVHDISAIPRISIFNTKGKLVEDKILSFTTDEAYAKK